MLFSASRLDRRGFGTGLVQDLWIDGPGSGTSDAIALTVYGSCKGKPSGLQDVRLVDKDYKFGFKVMVVKRAVVTQGALSDRRQTPTPFDNAFPDLAREARGREEVDFSALAPQIYAEAAKGDEVFEAFGIKFHGEQVTSWGIVILIGVQLYLVMYLRQLFNRLKPDDPGWDVPWMAMDQSLLARSMLFVSFCVLPFIAALFVLLRAESQASTKIWLSISTYHLFMPIGGGVLRMLTMIVGFGVSVTLSILSWRYRPQVGEPTAPAQMFE
jgi:hypothetical protein